MTTTVTEDRPAVDEATGEVQADAETATPDPAATLAAANTGTGTSAMALRDDQTAWTPAQRAMLRAMGVDDDVLDEELQLFLYECQRRKLDPFAKQIYLIGRKDKNQGGRKVYRSQVSVDGFRLIARRAANKDGIEYGYEDTTWYDRAGREFKIWLNDNEQPAGAKVVVLRNGMRYPAEARFKAYAAKFPSGDLMGQWPDKGDVMIAKCAESLALRKAFPEDLGGLYTIEEMEQADNPVTAQATAEAARENRQQGQRRNGNGNGGQRRQQNGQQGQAAAPAADPGSEENRAWFTDSLATIPSLDQADLDMLRAEGMTRTQENRLTVDDARHLSAMIVARRDDLKDEALRATQLDPEDSWADAINGIASQDDAGTLRAEVTRQLTEKEITRDRHTQVMKAINGRVQMILNDQAAQVTTTPDGTVQGTVVQDAAA